MLDNSELQSHGNQGNEFLSYIGAELRIEWETIRERRGRQVQYLRTYMAALGAFLVVVSYGVRVSQLTRPDQIAYGVLGLVVWGIVLVVS
jgi:hypothetical protein